MDTIGKLTEQLNSFVVKLELLAKIYTLNVDQYLCISNLLKRGIEALKPIDVKFECGSYEIGKKEDSSVTQEQSCIFPRARENSTDGDSDRGRCSALDEDDYLNVLSSNYENYENDESGIHNKSCNGNASPTVQVGLESTPSLFLNSKPQEASGADDTSIISRTPYENNSSVKQPKKNCPKSKRSTMEDNLSQHETIILSNTSIKSSHIHIVCRRNVCTSYKERLKLPKTTSDEIDDKNLYDIVFEQLKDFFNGFGLDFAAFLCLEKVSDRFEFLRANEDIGTIIENMDPRYSCLFVFDLWVKGGNYKVTKDFNDVFKNGEIRKRFRGKVGAKNLLEYCLNEVKNKKQELLRLFDID